MNPIYVIVYSLHYEEREPIFFRQIERERLQSIRNSYKYDWYAVRVTPQKFMAEAEVWERKKIREQYDQAIIRKYNVPSNYRENRWFMEQVRPTVF